MTLSIETLRTAGLGDSTHVLVHQGIALIVDPQRDIDRFQRVVDAAGAELRMVLETHLHNDYVSGGLDLSRKTGAELVVPAGAAPVFRHRPAFHHEDIDLGGLVVRPIHTPGHTPEHTSYVVVIAGREEVVFSGGSLLVGSAGRTDLLGLDRAESLARLQYGSVNRLAALAEQVGLYPTHGAGSFCTTTDAGTDEPGTARATSTIGVERQTSPVLAYDDEDSFVKGQLARLVPYPAYYRHMGPINTLGASEPNLEAPILDETPDGVTVIDARSKERYAAGHVPGAIGIALRDTFGTWVGWLTEHNTPLALVLDAGQDVDEAMRQLIRIGYDDVRGVVRNPSEGLESHRTVDVTRYAEAARSGAQLLDVRSPSEWDDGFVEGSVLCYLPDLARETPPGLDPSAPVWVACATGLRASTAAGFLQDRGFEPVVLLDGGATDVLRRASHAS